MVSGSKSKATRTKPPAVVRRKAPPWGLIAGVTVVVLFAAVIFGYAFVRGQENQTRQEALAPYTPTAENQDPSTQLAGIQIQSFEGGQHVGATERVAYTHSPPMGGAHDGVWAACNGVVYSTPVRSENLVHSMEHGAVWIAYNPAQVTGDALATLTTKVENQNKLVLSPFPDLDQPISLQSWGHQLKLTDVNDPRIDQFIAALRMNVYTHPEPGASCDELTAQGFSQDNPPPYVPAPAAGEPGVVPEASAGTGVVPDAGTAGQPVAPTDPALAPTPAAPTGP
jgi:hypothetical protein